jgi:hypothetical protein
MSDAAVVYFLIITFKVFRTAGLGLKSLLLYVIVNEPLTEISMSKLFRAVECCDYFRNLILSVDIAYLPAGNYGLGLK